MSPTTVLITVIIIAIIALISAPFIWAYQAIQNATDILSGDIGAEDTEPRPLQCWEGGKKETCSCPDHGRSLIDFKE